MKVKIEVNVVKHSDGTFSARIKENYKVEQVNLKHVSPEEIGKYVAESIKESSEKEIISIT